MTEVGDSVEQDEELATIETDKIDVAVNAPDAGIVKELLVKEEDTVTVGQDLLKLEVGGSSRGGGQQEAKQQPKEPASKEQKTSSQPEGHKEQASVDRNGPRDEKQQQQEKHVPQAQRSERERQQHETKGGAITSPNEERRADGEVAAKVDAPFGNRGERRVRYLPNPIISMYFLTCTPGENEQNATSNCRAAEAIAKHRRIIDNVQ